MGVERSVGPEYVSIERGRLLTQARLRWEYTYEFWPDGKFLRDLKMQGVDLFSFIERTFLRPMNRRSTRHVVLGSLHAETETIGLLSPGSYEAWLRSIGKKARQDIRRSERRGVQIRSVRIDDKFLRDALAVYNETPKRQSRRYSGYGISFQHLREKFSQHKDTEVLGAYDETKLIGLIWMILGDRVAQFASFVHLVSERHKLPMNALVAAAVKNCCERGIQFLVYPIAFGLQPGIDSFRLRLRFLPFRIRRYYVLLTRRGSSLTRLRVHRPLQYVLPRRVIMAAKPIYDHISLLVPASAWYRMQSIDDI